MNIVRTLPYALDKVTTHFDVAIEQVVEAVEENIDIADDRQKVQHVISNFETKAYSRHVGSSSRL